MRFNGRNGSPADPSQSVARPHAERATLRERRCSVPGERRAPCASERIRDLGDPTSRSRSSWVPGLAALARDTSVRVAARKRTVGRSLIHDVKQRSVVRSRGALLRPGSRLFLSRPSPKRGGRSADRRTISFVAFARRDWSARVRRGASHDAGRSPLGAPPWRFSAGGRASISGIASGSVQRAPRSQVVMPGGRCPGPPEPAVTSRGRRTPLPAPPFRTVSGRRPSMSEDGKSYTINSFRSQQISSYRS